MNRVLVLAALLPSACIAPENPFDPATDPERQAQARLKARVLLVDQAGAPLDVVKAEAEAAVVLLSDELGDEIGRRSGGDLDVVADDVGVHASLVFDGLVPGRRRLDVLDVASRFTTRPSPLFFDLVPGSELDVGDLTFVAPKIAQGQGPGRIAGVVQIDSGAPAAGVVEVFERVNDAMRSLGSRTVDSAGRFDVDGLVTGSYAVVASSQGYAPAYAADLDVGEQDGAALAYELSASTALVLQPVASVLRFPDSVPLVDGVRYTSADAVDVDVLAFGGATPVTRMRLSTSADFGSSDGGTAEEYVDYAATTSVALPGVDGAVVIYAQFLAESEGGFVLPSPVFSTTVVRDTVPPVVSTIDVVGAATGEDGLLYLSAAAVAPSLAIEAADVHGGVAAVAVVEAVAAPAAPTTFVPVDAAPGAASIDLPLTLSTGDGAKQLWVFLKDHAGNVAAPWDVDVVVDTEAPDADTFVVDGDAFAALTPFVSVTVETADADAVELALASSGTPSSFAAFTSGAPVAFALPPGDGVKQVVGRLRDRAGNTSDVLLDAIVVDSAVGLSAPALVASTTIPLDLSGRAADAWRVAMGAADADGIALLEALTFGAAPADVVAAGDGPWRVFAQARDAGGATSTVVSADVVVDTEAPAFGPGGVVIDSGAAATRFVSVAVAVDAADDDAHSMAIVTDGTFNGELLVPFSSFLTAVLPAGDCETFLCKQVCVVLVDEAGNDSDPQCDTITLDTTPPGAPTISPLFGTVRTDNVEITLVAPARDLGGLPVAAYEISSRGGDFAEVQGSGPFSFALRPNRENELCVRGKDEAGNVGIEDCAVVEEASTVIQIGNGIDARGADLFGDWLAFSGKGAIYLNDLRRGPPTSIDDDDEKRLSVLTDGLDNPDGGVAPGTGGDLRLGGDKRTLVAIHGQLEGPGAARYFNVVVRALESDFGPGTSRDFDPSTPGVPDKQVEKQFPGDQYDTDGRYVVSWRDTGGGSGPVLRLDMGTADIPNLAAASAKTVRASARLCPRTAPRVARGVVVWCELSAGDDRPSLWRATTADGNTFTAEELTAAPKRVAALREGVLSMGGDVGYQQPQISERFIVWAEQSALDGPVSLVYLQGGIGAALASTSRLTFPEPLATRTPCSGTITIDGVSDLSGGRVVLQFQRGDDLGLNDVALFDVDRALASQGGQTGAVCLTDDLPPNDELRVDGTRVIYRDLGQGESVAMFDLSRTSWLSANPELVFEAVTSGFGEDGVPGAAAWLETRPVMCTLDAQCGAGSTCVAGSCSGPRRLLTLLARRLTASGPRAPVRALAQDVQFAGPSTADPAFVAGGARVAYLQTPGVSDIFLPPPYTLRVLDVDTQAQIAAKTNAARAMTLDPGGTLLAWVDHDGSADPGRGVLMLDDLSNAAAAVTIDPAVQSVPFVDVEVRTNGTIVVLYQRGGQVQDRDSGGDLMMWRSNNPTPVEVRVDDPSGGVIVPLAATGAVRSPKIARVDDDLYVAWRTSCASGCARAVHVCRLNTATGVCNDDVDLTLENSNASDPVISRDGLVAFVGDEEDVDEVILYDVRAGRRIFATPVVAAAGDRNAPDIARGHLVWTDSSLGTGDVHEMILSP